MLALTRDSFDGAATGSMYTAPVNQSACPRPVSTLFLVMCMSLLSAVVLRCGALLGRLL